MKISGCYTAAGDSGDEAAFVGVGDADERRWAGSGGGNVWTAPQRREVVARVEEGSGAQPRVWVRARGGQEARDTGGSCIFSRSHSK